MENNWSTIEKQSVIKVLFEITAADGKGDPREILPASKICKRLNISDEEFDLGGVLSMPQAMLNLSFMNKSKQVQMSTMMLDIIESDGHTHNKEVIIFNAVLRFMGFDVSLKAQ